MKLAAIPLLTIPIFTKSENEAVTSLIKYEVNKIAADKRCVSFHTQKNQVKSAMAKLGVTTQIGLIKEFFQLCIEAEIDLRNIRQLISIALLVIYAFTNTNFDSYQRYRPVNRRRQETELIAINRHNY